jgi:FtsZ-interacting cell division protein ZipA
LRDTGGVVVGIVIVGVLIALVFVMKWADRRDRANGHTNRSIGDMRSTIRDQRTNLRTLRRPGGNQGARSPHEVRRGDDRYRR